ncbi:receptor protein kinase-like protein ZAR1 [Impatiens glandulifera]|uniref:receptor protein kinase-like protein ZAR1 n=1 Tax=Impatiens glandulifera TaxID=253017 RepID=UPI001FB0E695|nr:receptor protein kinase-like protein ZAR1 [Impatiens glandulifera]
MFRFQFLTVTFLFLSITTTNHVHFAVSLSADGLSLLSFKSAMDDGGLALPDWDSADKNPCHWTGITCINISSSAASSDEPRVVGIALSGKKLKGYIPSELGSLYYLRRLNLHANSLYGTIPDQLFNASSLHSLYLYDNNLSGSIPPSICGPSRILNIDLSHNSISGEIPKDLRNCRQLQRLILARNSLSGEIPLGIWPEMANLLQLDLSDNNLSGSIPQDFGELKSLTGTLNLSFNHFSGTLPKSLGDLPMTVSFDLRDNNVSGEIPQSGSFTNQGPTAFLNNPFLCGFPLQKSCLNSSQSVNGTENPPPGSDNTASKKGLNPGLIILISVADAVGISFIGLIILYLYWRKKDSHGCSCRGKEKLGDNPGTIFSSCLCFFGISTNDSDVESEKGGNGAASGSGVGGGEGDLVAIDKGFSFELDELLRASAYVLGKSGLGIVYKVVLGNGCPVAVRRLGEGGEQRYKEFVAEVQAIGRVKHPNIVKLRAYYWAPDEKLLISDFISNGNLASALRGKPSSNLTWSTRLSIAKGTARGLAYLHECSPRKFVHGDIKPSNILLDNDFHPYICDFGLTKLITITGNNPSSSGGFIGGALPYLKSVQQDRSSNNYKAPEARVTNTRPTQKWDVYSFGVVLLELLTGKSPDNSSPGQATSTSTEIQDLVRWVKEGFEEEKRTLSDMVDPCLLHELDCKKEMMAVIHVALACCESDAETRPRMKTVLENLEKI